MRSVSGAALAVGAAVRPRLQRVGACLPDASRGPPASKLTCWKKGEQPPTGQMLPSFWPTQGLAAARSCGRANAMGGGGWWARAVLLATAGSPAVRPFPLGKRSGW